MRLSAGQPLTAHVRAVMRSNRRRDTQPELALRRALHASGHRYRVDHAVQAGARRVRIDIAFPRRKIAVFVDGCFWHGCPEHSAPPKTNPGYWGPKIARNIERDKEHDKRLLAAGWTIVRVWAHEPTAAAADRIASLVAG